MARRVHQERTVQVFDPAERIAFCAERPLSDGGRAACCFSELTEAQTSAIRDVRRSIKREWEPVGFPQIVSSFLELFPRWSAAAASAAGRAAAGSPAAARMAAVHAGPTNVRSASRQPTPDCDTSRPSYDAS